MCNILWSNDPMGNNCELCSYEPLGKYFKLQRVNYETFPNFSTDTSWPHWKNVGLNYLGSKEKQRGRKIEWGLQIFKHYIK